MSRWHAQELCVRGSIVCVFFMWDIVSLLTHTLLAHLNAAALARLVIMAGDAIDQTLGARLQISTLAAAGQFHDSSHPTPSSTSIDGGSISRSCADSPPCCTPRSHIKVLATWYLMCVAWDSAATLRCVAFARFPIRTPPRASLKEPYGSHRVTCCLVESSRV